MILKVNVKVCGGKGTDLAVRAYATGVNGKRLVLKNGKVVTGTQISTLIADNLYMVLADLERDG